MQKTVKYIALAVFSCIVLFSCEKNEENEGKTSTANSSESHNTGQNCMNCHTSGGQGEGVFTIAGSVYDSNGNPYSNATIKLYSQAGGQGNLVMSLETDKKGNFYTTRNVDFNSGIFPCIVNNSSGNSTCMSISTSVGSCNSCHGNNVAKITVY